MSSNKQSYGWQLKDRYKYFNIATVGTQGRFSCVKCKDILIDSRQSVCGCRFCYNCVLEYLRSGTTICSGCNSDSVAGIETFSCDKAVEREISGLEIRCINDSCDVVCKLSCLAEHLGICDYRQVICGACNEGYPYKEGKEHKSTTCSMLGMKCEDCGLEMTKKVYRNVHKNVDGGILSLCDNWKGVCPNNCSDVEHDNIKSHLDDCENMVVGCVMRDVGCMKMFMRRDIGGHVVSDASAHLLLLLGEIIRSKKDNEEMKSKLSDNNTKRDLEIDLLKDSVAICSASVVSLSGNVASCLLKCDNLETEATSLRRYIEPENERYGQHIWKIENISGKINNAKQGVDVQILSAPFYSAVRGYKMFLKMYPNGDGNSAGRSMSLYFAIGKGDYDNEIMWPFKQKISISLLSTRSDTSDRAVNMKPDNNDSCYGRPRQALNVAAGQPNFISHVDLMATGRYIMNDSITLLAKVM